MAGTRDGSRRYIQLDLLLVCDQFASLATRCNACGISRKTRDTMRATGLTRCQRGQQPDDFKPMPGIGNGVAEIRIAESSGALRVIYVARHVEAVYVRHAFQKKTQTTAESDLDLARMRFRQLDRGGP
jgi:phage-related protein